MPDQVNCPKCGAAVEITGAIAAQLRAEHDGELQQLREQMEQQAKAQLAKEKKKLADELTAKAREDAAAESAAMQQELDAAKKKLDAARKTELELRRREVELADKTKELELQVARQLAQERDKLIAAAREKADEEHRLKEAEKDHKISGLLKQIDELKRKAEQGSQQTQGDVAERSIEEVLREHFPDDVLETVAKGQRGADVVQHVVDAGRAECGTILWESKHTKRWEDGWLAKLRDDQRAAKAVQAVLVSSALPQDCDTFASIDQVWVSSRQCIVGVASALRMGLIEVAHARRALNGRASKIDELYRYLASPDFKHRVAGIVEAMKSIREDLDAERRAMERIWSRREKQIARAEKNMSGFYGDLQGIIGAQVPELEALEMPHLEAPEHPHEPNASTFEP